MTVDNYAPNPLADRAKLMEPDRYALVEAVKAPPKLFAGGKADLPAFTASGIDPELLLKLPAGIRHAAAAEPNIAKVHHWFEEYSHRPDGVMETEGWRDAKERVRDWLENTDLDTRTPEQRQADDDAEYAAFFAPASDVTTYAAEQFRRRRDGDESLPDFRTLNQQHRNHQQWAANSKVVSE